MLRREQIERLKERYPAGTVVRLGQMEGEHQMPSGMEGKVIDVDDIGQIHVEWENGSTLQLPNTVVLQTDRNLPAGNGGRAGKIYGGA